jgi:hypothetical protein
MINSTSRVLHLNFLSRLFHPSARTKEKNQPYTSNYIIEISKVKSNYQQLSNCFKNYKIKKNKINNQSQGSLSSSGTNLSKMLYGTRVIGR